VTPNNDLCLYVADINSNKEDPEGRYPTAAERRANAELIAAAPDLLAALEDLFAQCTMVHRYGGSICNQKKADAAIAAGMAAIREAKGI